MFIAIGFCIGSFPIEEEWSRGRKLRLPTHEEHFYSVHRYEFSGSIQLDTNNQCHICMLVEGKIVSVKAEGFSGLFHYAETFVVPAATGTYEVFSSGEDRSFLVVAQVKDEHC